MPQALGELERGNNADGDRTQSLAPPNEQTSQRKSSFGDSSGPLFSIYSKAAEEEDNKMVKRWQKDADGILIFTGLFSAAVAVLLAVTVQDLRPNIQDTSAFYLKNIYQFLADPNVTNSSISPPVAEPPFSPKRYTIWVNVLWFLSLVISLSCALLATSLHQWARRYIRLTQPARCSPEKRARMRAFFADAVDKMHIPWAVEGLPTLLHLSLFLFFAGLGVFLINVHLTVFIFVISWIGLFSTVYGLITLLPLIRQDSPYSAPLSIPAWFLYVSIRHVTFKVLASITSSGYDQLWERYADLRDRHRDWMSGGVEKAAEDMASERSSEIDLHILGWTISALGDDDSLETFFETIPGFFNSKVVNNVQELREHLPDSLSRKLWDALDGFLGRTLSSNSITDSVKLRRLDISMNVTSLIREDNVSSILENILFKYWDQVPKTIEMGQTLARWCASENQRTAQYAQCIVNWVLATVPERDACWVELAARIFGLPEREIRDIIVPGDDSVSLAILIQVTRNLHTFRSDSLRDVLTRFSKVDFFKVDILNTLPRLQHDFCTLWNELVEEARRHTIPVYILREIRHLYIALHQGTDASPTLFSNFTNIDITLFLPSSYPLCNIASHRPGSTAYVPAPNSHAVPRKVKEATNIPGPLSPSDQAAPSEIGDNSQPLAVTAPSLLVQTSSRPTDASLSGVVAAPTPTLTPIPVSITQPVPTELLASCDVGDSAIIASNHLLPSPSLVGLPTPPPPHHIPHSPKAEFPALVSSKTPSRPIDNGTLPHLRARGLVNTGSKCIANAVLQLLVHSPPFWNLFRKLRDLKGMRGEGDPETGGSATPLVDSMVRFSEEFMFQEKEPPPTQQPLQQAAGENRMEGGEEKKDQNVVDSFEPIYVYDAMKEKRQLKKLLDSKHQDAGEFLDLYLDALDEELVELNTYISTHKPALTPIIKEQEDEAQSAEGQTEVRKRNYSARSAESPIPRIFGGGSLSTVRAPSQPDTVKIETWKSLRLNIQPDSVHTIQDALARLSQAQPVKVGQSSSSVASQEVLLEALPRVLVLHLERFLYDSTADRTNKISKRVQFSQNLKIPLEIMAPVARKSADPHYQLYGVLYHRGESTSDGHYTVNVLNGDSDSGEAWLHIDDEAVNTVRHEDVFGGHDNEPGDGKCAYMLFYCQIASYQT